MAGNLSKVINATSDFYNGATKGAKKATWTVNKVSQKNNMAKNLNVANSIKRTNSVIKNNPNTIRTNYIYRGLDKKQININPSLSAKAGDFIGSGTRESVSKYRQMDGKDKSLIKAIHQGHQKADGSGLDMKKIAGTTVGIGVAGRIATGGGLYRDRYGNVNLPGVPFV